MPIHQKIQKDWEIFSFSSLAAQKQLLIDIVSETIPATDLLFNESVGIRSILKPAEDSIPNEKLWEDFSAEIKTSNRFFLKNEIDLLVLEMLLGFNEKQYASGHEFFRGRTCDIEGFDVSEMGKPNRLLTKPGRANPQGIPYLYISSDRETTIYETRSILGDFICIGRFVLREPITIVSIINTNNISPFILGDQIENYLLNKIYLVKLEQVLSKPISRSDDNMEYLPTQYLCEFVKSLGYNGIEYSSAMKRGGTNLAIFNDDDLIACSSVELYRIDSLDLHSTKIKFR